MSETYAIGDHVWTWSPRSFSARYPGVVIAVHRGQDGAVSAISTKPSASSNERPTVHRMTRAGMSGVRRMSDLDVERVCDLGEWHRMRYLSAVVGSGGSVRVIGWRISAHARYAETMSIDDLGSMAAEIATAQRLLEREAARTRAEALP